MRKRVIYLNMDLLKHISNSVESWNIYGPRFRDRRDAVKLAGRLFVFCHGAQVKREADAMFQVYTWKRPMTGLGEMVYDIY